MAETEALKRQRLNAMSEAEFRAFTSAETLRTALIERHTLDLLAGFDERGDPDLLNQPGPRIRTRIRTCSVALPGAASQPTSRPARPQKS
jgi:hypothetical protein